jgi:predicted PurR-regulated permease PerM
MEQRILTRLGRMNRTTLFLLAALYVFLAFLIPGVIGAVMLLALAAGLVWLMRRTWATRPGNARIARIVVVAVLVVVAVVKLTR